MSKIRAFLANFDETTEIEVIRNNGETLHYGPIKNVYDKIADDYTIVSESVKVEEGCIKIYVK